MLKYNSLDPSAIDDSAVACLADEIADRPTIVHLTASPCFGGPERQMLELGLECASDFRSIYLTFREEDRCWAFVENARTRGFQSLALRNDMPRLWATYQELSQLLKSAAASVVLCHGYKSNLLGLLAARAVGIPAVSVSRGWTRESPAVRLYEALDRRVLRWMDHVVGVSDAQAEKVRRAGVRSRHITTIRNAVRFERFGAPDPSDRKRLEDMFERPVSRIVGAAGRLSPEKGFDVLLRAASLLAHSNPEIGLVWFGDGPLFGQATRQIEAAQLNGSLVLAGYRADLDRLLPHFDLLALPSYTEGLPNVALEALAARVPVVATCVGGIPEIVEDGRSGFLVPAGDSESLAKRIVDALSCEQRRIAMGEHGRRRVIEEFTFEAQAAAYRRLLRSAISRRNGTGQSGRLV